MTNRNGDLGHSDNIFCVNSQRDYQKFNIGE